MYINKDETNPNDMFGPIQTVQQVWYILNIPTLD